MALVRVESSICPGGLRRSVQQDLHLLNRRCPAKGFAWAAVELGGDRVERGLAVSGEVAAFGQVLAQETVCVFVAAALPRRGRVAEVDLHAGGGGEALVGCELLALVPGQRAHQLCRQVLYAALARRDDLLAGAPVGEPSQQHVARLALDERGDL